MRHAKAFAVCLLASAAVMPAAYAANSAPTAMPPGQKAADQDFGKLSKDGMAAFRDMHMARLAIFDADPAKAKSEIADAKSALDKAKSDETVFMKAESELKPPAGEKVPATNASATSPAATAPTGEKVAWLPIDAQISLGENFVATPEKAGAIGDANKRLQAGDKKGAIERLKVAGIDVGMTLAVLPLDQTVTDVGNAANLIDQGKYYEANATLKQVEDRMRFDVVDATSMPKSSSPTPPASTTPTPAPAPSK